MWGIIINILLFITVIIGTVTYKKYNHTFLKYFLFFLFYDLINETTAFFVGNGLKKNTFILYNIYMFVSVLFYLFTIYHYTKKNKVYLPLLIILYILFCLSNVLFFQKSIQTSQTYSLIIGSFFILIGVIYLFVELLKSDDILKINKMLLFWLSIGILIFYAGIVPIYVMIEFLNYKGIFKYILVALNVIMLSCFSIGFIVTKKEYNK